MQTFEVGDLVRVKDGTYAKSITVIESLGETPEGLVYRCEIDHVGGQVVVPFSHEQLESLDEEPQPMSRTERGLLFVEREELDAKRDNLRTQLRSYGATLEEIGRELRDAVPGSLYLLNTPSQWTDSIHLQPVSCVPTLWNELVATCVRLKEINSLLYPSSVEGKEVSQ